MNLKKILILASMALAAVAFTAPATAQAQDHGLFEGGLPVEDTANVALTSTNLKTETGLGTLTCAKVTLHYHVEHEGNAGTNLLLEPTQVEPETETNNATTEGCLLNGTHTVHILKGGTHTVSMNTWGHGVVKASFTATITHNLFGDIHCNYTGDVTVQGTNTTNVVHVGPSKLNSAVCGEGTMSGTFAAENSAGTALEGKFQAT